MVRKNGSNCLHRATVRGVSANGRRGGPELGKHGSLMRVMNQTENNRSRGLVGDWLAGRALPGFDLGLKLRALLENVSDALTGTQKRP